MGEFRNRLGRVLPAQLTAALMDVAGIWQGTPPGYRFRGVIRNPRGYQTPVWRDLRLHLKRRRDKYCPPPAGKR